MPNFNYRALAQNGDIVSGSITAPTKEEVVRRIEYLGLVPIETEAEAGTAAISRSAVALFNQPRPEDVTIFTRDLALLLRAGARLDDGLQLLADDAEAGRLSSTLSAIRTAVLSGESFADALSQYPALFPAMYVALVRVGETAGTLDYVLELLANERLRSEALRRKLTSALQYPAFLLAAACSVLVFFLMAVLPQFSAILRDSGAKLDPIVASFLDLSDLMRANTTEIALGFVAVLLGSWLFLRRAPVMAHLSHLPAIRQTLNFYRTGLFCRNLSILLGSGVPLTATLRILADIMAATGNAAVWAAAADRVRQGGKLSEALAATTVLPPMAVRMLRIGEETGQLPVLASRIADFYETKLQRSLDRAVGIAGPLAIIVISVVVGGLIVSIMTALLSLSDAVG